VLTSNSGASAELVTPEITGMHFRAGDAADLAAKVRELTHDPARLKRMREPARAEYQQKYNSDLSHKTLVSIYDRAMDRCGKKAVPVSPPVAVNPAPALISNAA